MSTLLFALVFDAVNLMFKHALESGVLIRVPLGNFGKMCHLQYTDNLLVMTTGVIEDLIIIKLILYLFKGMSGLAINFHKTCLYSSSSGQLLGDALAKTLSCSKGLLPVTYLGLPLSG